MEMNPSIEPVGTFWVLKNDNSISQIARDRGTIAYDRDFIDMPELLALPKGSLVVDVGAFIGDTSRIFLDMGFSVVAFEVMPDAFECLQHNCPEAKVHNLAIGDGRMIAMDEETCGNMGGRPVHHVSMARENVLTRRLGDLLETVPSALKIDVEGFEPAVLAGALGFLASPTLKVVIVEFNPHALAWFG